MRKSLSFILSLLLVLTLCLGGCNPSEPAESSVSLEESSIPEENSVPEESSQPEESSTPEESSAPEESSQPEESSILEESSQPEESSVPDESSQLAESSEDTAWASAYLDIVEELQAEYGEGQTITYQVAEGFYGLVVVQLIDFDGNGQSELFCGYLSEDMAFQNEAYQRIYSYDNGVITLFDESAGETGGVNPISRVKQTKDGTIYLIQLDGRMEDYWILKDGKFSVDHHVERDSYVWDEEQLDDQTFKTRYDDFWAESMTLIDTAYFIAEDGKGVQVLSDTQETIEYLQKLVG